MAITCPAPPPSYDAASTPLAAPDTDTESLELGKSLDPVSEDQKFKPSHALAEPHRSKLFVLSSQPLPWRKRLYLTTWLNDTFDPVAKRPSSSWLYEFVFPPCYENVYISPPIISRRRDDMPRYCIGMLGDLCGVQEEPVVVLRKVHSGVKVGGTLEAMSGDSEASRQAEVHVEEVCRLVAEEIGSKARHVESAKTAVDYHVKWSAISAINRESKHRMSSSVLAGSEGSAGLVGAEHLLRRLEGFLVFVGRRPEDTPCVERLRGDVELIRRRVAEMVKSQKSIMAGQ
ncbi:hypothetical protein LTS10_001271 [Elasticomyces elasticus]|nr:hypothetical protein LTS10_001271 [Elasticomyces elasticus]